MDTECTVKQSGGSSQEFLKRSHSHFSKGSGAKRSGLVDRFNDDERATPIGRIPKTTKQPMSELYWPVSQILIILRPMSLIMGMIMGMSSDDNNDDSDVYGGSTSE